MRGRFVLITAASFALLGPLPALANPSDAGTGAQRDGGLHVSGGGVVGYVGGGSGSISGNVRGPGGSIGSSRSGPAVSGAEPTAVQDGIVQKLRLEVPRERPLGATNTSSRMSDTVTWLGVALVIVGVVLLSRRRSVGVS
jgi:hypothetical protein